MQPEALIRNLLRENSIESFSTLDDFSRPQFCVVIRTTDNREYFDLNRAFKARTYNLLVHCYSTGGKLAVLDFSDTVSEVLEKLYWEPLVDNLELVGGNSLPTMEAHAGYSLSLAMSVAGK